MLNNFKKEDFIINSSKNSRTGSLRGLHQFQNNNIFSKFDVLRANSQRNSVCEDNSPKNFTNEDNGMMKQDPKHIFSSFHQNNANDQNNNLENSYQGEDQIQ